jgi:hypothetical protein
MTTKLPLQKILQGILHLENESKQNEMKTKMKGQAIPNHRRKKGKKAKSSIDSAAHNQTLYQQRQLHNKNHHIPININTECQ